MHYIFYQNWAKNSTLFPPEGFLYQHHLLGLVWRFNGTGIELMGSLRDLAPGGRWRFAALKLDPWCTTADDGISFYVLSVCFPQLISFFFLFIWKRSNCYEYHQSTFSKAGYSWDTKVTLTYITSNTDFHQNISFSVA